MIKKKLLGVPVVAILAILVVGFASAALVSYLSNSVEAEVDVQSPLTLEVNTEDGGWGSLDNSLNFGSIIAGETITFYQRAENLANASITANEHIKIVNYPGIDSCAELASVYVRTSTNGAGFGSSSDVASECELQGSTGNTYLTFNLPPTTFAPFQVDVTEIVVTFNTQAFGQYVWTNELVPASS